MAAAGGWVRVERGGGWGKKEGGGRIQRCGHPAGAASKEGQKTSQARRVKCGDERKERAGVGGRNRRGSRREGL